MTTTEQTHSLDPSLHTGNLQAHEGELHEVMSRIVPIFELSDEEFEEALPEFVAERMTELADGASTEVMTAQTKGTEEFIVPERPQQIMGIMTKPFLMDDPELYIKLIEWTRKQYRDLQAANPGFDEEKKYVNAAIRGTQVGQWAYFGSYAGSMKKLIQASADIISDEGDISPYVSIAEIGGGAVCHQRAAAVHNTLRILGIDSKFATGTLSQVVEGVSGESELHAYVVISRNGKRILYDPTNPVAYKKEGETVTWLAPKLTEIPADTHELDVELPEVTITSDGAQENQLAHHLRYTFN